MLVGYCRVSTFEQNLELQIQALKQAGCDRIFEDRGVSGSTMNRPALIAAKQFCRAGDTFVVWKLDRLGRTVSGTVNFVEGLTAENIGFKSLTEGCGTKTPGETLLFNFLCSVAQWELQTIKERSIAGLIAARNQGRVGGRPKKLTPQQVTMLEALKADKSLTTNEIAEQFGISRATLYRYIK